MSEDSALMTSHRPYLLRALYEWIADNGMTPHLLVDATRPAVQVPMHAVKDGKIVLNIAERAVSHLEMGNDTIRFSARFGGVSHPVSVPVGAVLTIIFSIGSIFYDGGLQLSSPPPPHVMKAYRKDVSSGQP